MSAVTEIECFAGMTLPEVCPIAARGYAHRFKPLLRRKVAALARQRSSHIIFQRKGQKCFQGISFGLDPQRKIHSETQPFPRFEPIVSFDENLLLNLV